MLETCWNMLGLKTKDLPGRWGLFGSVFLDLLQKEVRSYDKIFVFMCIYEHLGQCWRKMLGLNT